MLIGQKEFDFLHKSYVMGILNVTPDSFSDGGRYNSVDAALKQAERMIREGASIIDLGGESTRPGYEQISEQEEIERVCKVIEACKHNFNIPISLDTYKGSVAEAGIRAGCDMINDIHGLQWDDRIAAVIAEAEIPCCLMHNKVISSEEKLFPELFSDIDHILKAATQAGIDRNRIIIDPGIGFGKSYKQNLLLIHHLDQMKRWELPILLGTSRKSVIGLTLDLPVEEREEGTLATTVYGRMKGASVFRVHDVKANIRALKMTDVILRAGHQEGY